MGSEKGYLSVYIDADLLRRLDRLAAARDVSRSKLVEEMLLDQLGNSELHVAAMTNPTIVNALMGAMARPEVLRAMSSAMREDVDDEQLQLFQRAINAATEKRAARPKGTPGRRASKRDKRGAK